MIDPLPLPSLDALHAKATEPSCYNCTLTETRYLCQRCRQLYTFDLNGRMQKRLKGWPSLFHVRAAAGVGPARGNRP